MSYIGQEPTSVAFLTDTFSGNGSTVAFTMSVAPATTTSILVAITGVVQDPSTYAVAGTTLTFSAAPPSGTGNISVRYMGIPASGVTTTAYRTVTEFTATAGQTTFSVPSYTVGYIDVYRNGVRLGAADYTASNGTTVVLTNAATLGDLVVTESFFVSSVVNAIANSAGAVQTSNIADASVTAAKMASGAARSNFGAGAVLQVRNVQNGTYTSTTSIIPIDDTIPQNTEGAELFTLSITPTSATSKLLICVNVLVSQTGAGSWLNVALFQDSTANALTASTSYQSISTAAEVVSFNYYMTAGTTSATTFKVRYGSSAGNTLVVNGSGATGAFGGLPSTSMTIMEIAA